MVVCRNFPLPETSGGRKRAARLLSCMRETGIEPLVLTREHVSPEQTQQASRRGWRSEAFPPTRRAFRGRLIDYGRRYPAPDAPGLMDRLQQLQQDAVLIQGEEIWAMQYLDRVRAPAPLIASFYNVDSKARANPSVTRLPRSRRDLAHRGLIWRMSSIERRVSRRATVTVCVSDADRHHFDEVGAARTVVAPNGVDEAFLEMPPVEAESKDVLFFGTFAWAPNELGLADFIERTWPSVAAAVPGVRLRIAGPEPSDRVRRLAASAERADVLGFVPNLETELLRARCVIAPIPFGGGTRIKVLEALAAGRPVVGTAVGVENIGFQHGRHGFVADGSEDMGAHIVRLLGDLDMSRRLGEGGRQLARAYTWQEALKPVRDLYTEWLAAWMRDRDL